MGELAAEVLPRALGLALLALFMAFVPDRFPRLSWFVGAVGTVLIVGAFVYYSQRAPLVTALVGGSLVLVTWLTRYLAVVVKPRLKPATGQAIQVWADEMQLLDTLGWEYLDTWVVETGQSEPAFTAYERPLDGTRVGMVGTAPQGGVITLETLLDNGRGLVVTAWKRSATLRPHWMFRQVLRAPLHDLIRAHDEALLLLRTEGITPARLFGGDPLEFELYTSEKLRRYAIRYWWRWAFPFSRLFAPSSKMPLANQSRLERQVARYREAIEREPALT